MEENKSKEQRTKEKKNKEVIVAKAENQEKNSFGKRETIVNGKNLAIGRKHAVAVCNLIRGKDIDRAIKELEEVVKFKRAIPMRGEIPHRKGMMSGRYPVKACGIIIKLLKSLKSNALANELELEKFKIFCMANVASRPYKRFGRGRFKRTHITLKLIPATKKTKENKAKEKK